MGKTALVAGATGLVGSCLVKILCENAEYDTVKVLVRKGGAFSDMDVEEHVVDFEALDSLSVPFEADDIYCCLGTTMKKAGSKEAFYKVDYTYPLSIAKNALAHGASQFLIVTSMGAKEDSWVYYNKVKGEIEQAVRALSFKAAHIFRPSLLLGDREEERLGEDLAKPLMRKAAGLLVGPLQKYKPIEAQQVAHAMYKVAQMGRVGVNIFESHQIQRIR